MKLSRLIFFVRFQFFMMQLPTNQAINKSSNFSATKKKKKEKKKKRILKPENESESEQVKDERKENEIKEPSKFTPIGQNIIKKKLTVCNYFLVMCTQ